MFLKFSCNRLFIVFLFLFIFMSRASFAQGSATIKGVVYDQTTGEELTGANVFVKGTSVGAASDLDGNYTLRNVPEGKHTIVVSYIGYRPDTLRIDVPSRGTIEQNFALSSSIIQGEVITVTAQAQGQLEAINQQLTSDKIVNIVSEARIQELPDFNAAQAISRLPGVSTLESSGEANKVVIRGLAPQFNAVNVGGISLASTGSSQIGATSLPGLTSGSISNDRSVDLTMVTPYMIKSIEVFKSLTPDMNANAIGGVVNMNLREAPAGMKGDFMWQSGYTQKTGNYGNFRGVASISDRFFDNVLGAYMLVNGEQYDRDDDNMNATYYTGLVNPDPNAEFDFVQVSNVTLNRHKEVRKRFGANLILDYKFSTGILRSTNMFSRLNSDYNDYREVIDYKGNNINYTYREGLNTTDIGVNSVELENDFGFLSMQLKVANTFSRNSLPRSPLFQFTQTGGATTQSAQYDTPPEDLFHGVTYRGAAAIPLNSVSLFSSLYKENDQIYKADFKAPFNIGNMVSGFVKFGGEFRSNKHTNDQNTPYFEPTRPNVTSTTNIKKIIMDAITANFPLTVDGTGKFPASNFTANDSKLYEAFLDDKFGKIFWAADPAYLNAIVNYVSSVDTFNAFYASATEPGGWFTSLYQTKPNDYDYNEKYSAAYLMSQMNFGPDLLIVGGVRYENVESAFHAYNLLDGRNATTQTMKEVTVNPSNHFLLPMIQAKYTPNSWSDIRYSFTQTLARPDYHQLSPHYNMSNDRGNVWAGNPNLKPAQAFNHDLMITFHSNELGLLSFGAFYKEIKNFTYYSAYNLRDSAGVGFDTRSTYGDLGSPPINGATLNTYINSRFIAYVRGIEIDLQTRFWYLPFPLDGLLLGINYTHVNSATRYPVKAEKQFGTRLTGFKIVPVDSTRSGRLLYQPNDIANIFIGYDYKGFSAKISFVFQGNSVSNIAGTPEGDGFTNDYFRTDISVRQLLPWEGIQLFLDVNNINNRQNISRQLSIGGFTNQKNYGLTANLGVRYNLSM